jgi:hypothetical protein
MEARQTARIGRSDKCYPSVFRYKSKMNRTTIAIECACLCLACLSLSSCAGGRTAGERIADIPHWMGGLPDDAPPRSGTPEYDAWMAARAQEAARPKTNQSK